MTAPATKADLEKLGTAIDGLAGAMRASGEEQAALLREFVEVNRQRGGHVQTVNVPPSPAPQPRTGQLVALAVLVFGLLVVAFASVVATLLQGQRITDLRADMHAERASRERFDNWNAQEVTAIRSYITNGRLQPMQPRPEPEPSP